MIVRKKETYEDSSRYQATTTLWGDAVKINPVK